MGSFFKTPKLEARSTLSPEQQSLLGPLADWIRPQINQSPNELSGLQDQLLRSTTAESQAMSERIFREALFGPSLRAFDRDVAPSIAGSFANIGGTLSTRRGQTLARERTNVLNQAQASLAGLLPDIMSFPLRQTLGQIEGFNSLQQQKYGAYNHALALALPGTVQTAQSPAGPGWGLLGQALGVGAFAATGGLSGLRGVGSQTQQVPTYAQEYGPPSPWGR